MGHQCPIVRSPPDTHRILVAVRAIVAAIKLSQNLPFTEKQRLRPGPLIDNRVATVCCRTGSVKRKTPCHMGVFAPTIKVEYHSAAHPIHERVATPREGCNTS